MRIILLFALAASPLFAQPIQEFPLNPRQAVDLPVSREITCVSFPGSVAAVAGAEMLIDAAKGSVEIEENVNVRFHVTHAANSNFVLVRSVQSGATGRLTVIFEDAAYIFNLRSVEANSLASAIFRRPEVRAAAKVEAPPEPVRFSPKIGLSLLDRARAYPVLVNSLPKAVEGVTFRAQNWTTILPNVEITVQEVYRFSREDAVVFLLRLKNITDSVVDLEPSTFAARVAQEKFEQSIANGPRVLQPGESADAEFAILGCPDGTRNDLSADNAFTILVSTSRRPAPAPDTEINPDAGPTP